MSANETIADIASDYRETAAMIRAELSQVPARREDELLAAESLEREADRIEAAAKRDCDEMLDALVRIGNWCAQDLAENTYTSDSSGNYLHTLNGLCEVCRPFMKEAIRLKRYGGTEWATKSRIR